MTRGPLFSFYGAKWRAATRYPAPVPGLPIVEPFAGSACYALRHRWPEVVLVEKDPEIAALWRWLINASAADVLSLPLMNPGEGVDAYDLDPGARALIGFWLGKGQTAPSRTLRANGWTAAHPEQFWGEARRARVASMVHEVDGWVLIEGDYSEAPCIDATWFIDPPYSGRPGRYYRCGSSSICFESLGKWVQQRTGRVIACEADGAGWLPFEPLGELRSLATVKAGEVVYVGGAA